MRKHWPFRLTLPRLGFWPRLGLRAFFFAILAGAVVWVAGIAEREMRTSFAQARFFTARARTLRYWVASGPNPAIRVPLGGPYDARFGYSRLPQFIGRLKAQHFGVTQQARQSPDLREQLTAQGYAIYNEKQHAGLQLFDRRGAPLYAASYPERSYERFHSTAGREHASLYRRQGSARETISRIQPGNRMEALRPGQRRLDRWLRESAFETWRCKHARHPDREIPSLAGRKDRRSHAEAPPDGRRYAARLPRR